MTGREKSCHCEDLPSGADSPWACPKCERVWVKAAAWMPQSLAEQMKSRREEMRIDRTESKAPKGEG